ncbi:hypothetical protein DFQ03_2528 [Maribacter caenipelagi]|uniref:Uncharacterized protein n=1 Tax=Maribacter caenipelagi TaxID=1447781 RepID=A0A4R7D2X8_9FLAO|nr:hypothetical protein [Maribacter caenipelagi]TDS14441.1 hypothetical protein DFQ03_2528 [Maribacter caenipelagi]|tara:strand:+ start:771 stop:911 length:141 start_codon:yes stop_codon:yes gene_type:complete
MKGLLPLVKAWFGKIWDVKDVIYLRFYKKLVVKGALLYAKVGYAVV